MVKGYSWVQMKQRLVRGQILQNLISIEKKSSKEFV